MERKESMGEVRTMVCREDMEGDSTRGMSQGMITGTQLPRDREVEGSPGTVEITTSKGGGVGISPEMVTLIGVGEGSGIRVAGGHLTLNPSVSWTPR